MAFTIGAKSAADLWRLPDDGRRRELIRGALREMAPSGWSHIRLAMRIGPSLHQHVEANSLGAVGAAEGGFLIATDPDTVRAPDVAFISQARIDEVGNVDGFWPGAPDLAVEVISPSDRYADVENKVLDWIDAGCRMVIVVNPRDRNATIYRSRADIAILGEGGTLEGGDIVRGWKLPVQEVFGSVDR